MPLTQDRMIAILDEAKGCLDEYRQFVEDVRNALTWEPKIAATILQERMQNTRLPAMVACAVERAHFERNASANRANAKRLREKRERNG